ncbi:2-dehydropantoate 2-reductase [Vibrio proteolyticus]|uniref:2-dehydropantoate 2-reductase n=1 Tax=Vibrio proteolyticus NBRC 13287 TaxID=1219065 RepID=U3BDW2_VIBPR|nr:2-dehydropantoate 2-reductase [Vibrio proteolyticus]GAD67919.1 2-dehydropantoate 2-reductase [Vibrio proteolyticus NBRC 13287]
MNIVVVGPGAIGSLWACHLALAGHNVSLWSRQHVTSINLALGKTSSLSFANHQRSALTKADMLLVTVKAWQVDAAIRPLIPHLDPRTILLFCHNGMGALDQLAPTLSSHPMVLATTTHGAFKPTPNQVNHTGLGHTQLGAYNTQGQQCQFLTDVLHHALPDVQWNEHIQSALWHKLAINCAINPLTALHQCRNGDLADPQFQAPLEAIIDELVQVMHAESIDVSKQALRSNIHNVIAATATNFSSMQQDVFYQRKTEIDFITGYLLRRATHHGIEVPTNSALYQQIKHTELSWTSS